LNRLQMNATLVERSAMRFSPAGVPVVEAQLQHRSRTVEAGVERLLDFPFNAVAIGDTARQLAQVDLGGHLRLDGFLAPRSRRSTRLTVHVLEITCCAAPDEANAAAHD
jgi:primosomal replication protein N